MSVIKGDMVETKRTKSSDSNQKNCFCCTVSDHRDPVKNTISVQRLQQEPLKKGTDHWLSLSMNVQLHRAISVISVKAVYELPTTVWV